MSPTNALSRYDQRHYARIVELAADAIICIDSDSRITLFNHGAERVFGYDAREILGEPLERLIPDRYRHGHHRHVSGFAGGPAVARHMAERRSIHALRKDGTEFPAEATISKTESHGEAVMTVILRDITIQKSARDELERMVAERTRALEEQIREKEEAQGQLVRIQRLEAFGQLTGGIAHDFNNLLTVIGGNLELLKDRLTDERQQKPVNRAIDAVAMGARLTQRLLSFARRNRLEPEILDLNSEILSVIDLLRRSLGENVTISSVLAPDLWTVKADASQVENAILNLAINARDAMPDGGKLIIETANAAMDVASFTAVAGETIASGDYVRLSISDTGCGMPPDVLARAFEPFFTTKEPGKGTGLGLASIYGFARQSGGYLTIYSEVGKGTTVNLYLARHGERGARIVGVDVGSTTSPAPRRILVVEDNPDVREITVERLEALGHTVTAAPDGRSAMAMLAGGASFDLVFSDVVMPGGLSGLDLAGWIVSERLSVKVLLTSGFTEELARGGASRGPDAPPLLRKPYSSIELSLAIERLFQEPSA